MSKISFAELEGLTGEMLPERAVLSAFYGGGGDDGGSNIVSNPVCATQAFQPAGILTILGSQGQQQSCHASVASTTF
ncbi:hypothetical protein ABZ079_00640 [Streptomyces sp. NPDC006314]|uniref:hypothetical protein n=1 Tax=Streptomyces sp. NPDC006314 TaxID=3154475 RepID=UPI0033A96CB7